MPEEVPIVEATWKRVHKAIEMIIGEGLPKTMSLFNKSLEQFEKQERDEINKKKKQEKLEAQKQRKANNTENKDNNTSTESNNDNKEEEEDSPQENEDGTSSPPHKRIKAD